MTILQKVGRLLASAGYCQCSRCKTPYYATDFHTTMYSESEGCFPLCEACWAHLSVEDRLPYYGEWVEGCREDGCRDLVKFRRVIDAVLEGK